jgi:hypothetical protein
MNLLKRCQDEHPTNGWCLLRVWWTGPGPSGHLSEGSLIRTAWCSWSYLDRLKLNYWVRVETELGLHLGLLMGSPTRTCSSGSPNWWWPPLSELNQRSRGVKTQCENSSASWSSRITRRIHSERWHTKIRRLRQYLWGWARNVSGAYGKKKRKQFLNRSYNYLFPLIGSWSTSLWHHLARRRGDRLWAGQSGFL